MGFNLTDSTVISNHQVNPGPCSVKGHRSNKYILPVFIDMKTKSQNDEIKLQLILNIQIQNICNIIFQDLFLHG